MKGWWVGGWVGESLDGLNDTEGHRRLTYLRCRWYRCRTAWPRHTAWILTTPWMYPSTFPLLPPNTVSLAKGGSCIKDRRALAAGGFGEEGEAGQEEEGKANAGGTRWERDRWKTWALTERLWVGTWVGGWVRESGWVGGKIGKEEGDICF